MSFFSRYLAITMRVCNEILSLCLKVWTKMCTKTPTNGMLRLILDRKKFESHQSRNSNSLSWRHFVLGGEKTNGGVVFQKWFNWMWCWDDVSRTFHLNLLARLVRTANAMNHSTHFIETNSINHIKKCYGVFTVHHTPIGTHTHTHTLAHCSTRSST